MGVYAGSKRGVRARPAPPTRKKLQAWAIAEEVSWRLAGVESATRAQHQGESERMKNGQGWKHEHGFIVKRQRKTDERRHSDPAITPRPFTAKEAAEAFERAYNRQYPAHKTYIERV